MEDEDLEGKDEEASLFHDLYTTYNYEARQCNKSNGLPPNTMKNLRYAKALRGIFDEWIKNAEAQNGCHRAPPST